MNLLFITLLLIATFTDIKKREIPDTICICVGVLSLFNIHPLGVFAALPFLICAMVNTDYIGGGDIKLTASVGLFLGYWDTTYGLMIALSFTTIIYCAQRLYHKITGRDAPHKTVPLAPFLTIGFLTAHYIF